MNKPAVMVGSLVLGLAIVGGAYFVSQSRTADAGGPDELRPVSQAELAGADGKDGRPCLVAVDGMVYRIDGFTLWQDGEHVTSEGRARCGADMSEVMRLAPHGLTKLDLLPQVGPLQP